MGGNAVKCMKCGREIDDSQVFCVDCLVEMEKYPIKPGTSVQLPKREELPAGKKSGPYHRSVLTPENQLAVFKKRMRFLTVGWAITLLVLAAVCFFMVEHLKQHPQVLPGQNYSSIITSESEEG